MVTPVEPVGVDTTRPSGRTRAIDVERVLLESAHRLLEREGIDALTVRRVATEAGVAPMGIYHRFGGKDGLVNALFIDGFAALGRALQETVSGDALDELRDGCMQYRRFALANRALYSVMFDKIAAGFDPDDDAMTECTRTFGVLVDAVRRAQASGYLRDGDPAAMAEQIWAACHGAVSLENRGIGFADDVDAHYAGLVATLLAGLASASSKTTRSGRSA